MSSYWRNDEKIKVSQTQVSVPSTNGRSYTATAGQGGSRMDFEIPPTVKFMDGKNSYLQFDIKLSGGAVPTRLQLDPTIGGQSVVKNLRIYSGSRGTLLEEITDYNAKVQIQYSYNTDDNLKKMRALKEGCLVSTIANRGTLGTSVSNCIDLSTNPYYKPVGVVPVGRDWGTADDFLTAKLSLPIHSGIFADSNKIFPVMMTQGLFIEVDLEDPARMVKQLDSVSRNRRVKQNPIFHGGDVGGNPINADGAGVTEIFLAKSNNMLGVAQCPFVKGEQVGLVQLASNKVANFLDGTDAGAHITITDITLIGGFVKLTCATFKNVATAGVSADLVSGEWALYSAACDGETKNFTTGVVILPALTKYDAQYKLSNAEIVCQQVGVDPRYEAGMMSKMREGGSIEIDIHSVTNYKHSLLRSNRNATINLASSNSRVKSSIMMITDSNTYNTAQLIGGLSDTYEEETTTMDGFLHSAKTGQVGIIDQLSNYQMLLDDKLVPSRPIVVSKINKGVSITAQPLIELEKALNQAKIVPRSFVDYNRNFLIGRAYALNDGVADLNNKSNQLQLQYNESGVDGVDRPPQKDKLIFAFQFHIRRISIKGDSVSVIL
tara:strand:+ start:3613 stop:5427 length:1815 start_codon:yes stop_codon:yes gene_type:complete